MSPLCWLPSFKGSHYATQSSAEWATYQATRLAPGPGRGGAGDHPSERLTPSRAGQDSGTCPDGETHTGPRLPLGPPVRRLCWLQLVQAPEGSQKLLRKALQSRGPLKCQASAGTPTAQILGCPGPSIHCSLVRVLVSKTIERSNMCEENPHLLCQISSICPYKSISTPSHLLSAPGG